MASNQDIPDVLVIGAGASGAAMVWSLAEAGINVLCLEQGDWLDREAFPATNPDSQLHWQTDFHPDPSVRRLPEDYPVNSDASPIAPYMYNAVGGSTVHYGSHYPRFHPSDFRVRTLDGVADDWPLTYDELEPYFDLNDRMMGVSGLQRRPSLPAQARAALSAAVHPPRRRDAGQGLRQAGLALVVFRHRHLLSGPTTAGSRTRAATCGPWPAPTSPTGRGHWRLGARLITKARVREILVDSSGKATGVLYYDADGNLVEQKAKAVVMACNGIGTPRLLLNSTSPLFPDGLANSSGLVGKCLMHHPAGVVVGVFDEWLGTEDGFPRGSTMLSQEFYETDTSRGFVRGYDLQILALGGSPLPTALGGLLGERIPVGRGASPEPSTSGSGTPSASPS